MEKQKYNPKWPGGLKEAEVRGSSIEVHFHGGYFESERAAVHNKIIRGILGNATPTEKPVVYFQGGGPGSGKSKIKEAPGVSIPKNAVSIDPDNIKQQLPPYKDMEQEGNRKASGFIHEESSLVAKRAIVLAIERKVNIVYDTTGDGSEESVKKKIAQFKKEGYRVEGLYATIPTEEALIRAKKRHKKIDLETGKTKWGRYVRPRNLRKTHYEVSQIFEKIIPLFDSMKLFDNSKQPMKVMAENDGQGTSFKVHDKTAYQAFLDKGKDENYYRSKINIAKRREAKEAKKRGAAA